MLTSFKQSVRVASARAQQTSQNYARLHLLTRRAQLCLAAPDATLLGSLDEFADGLFAAQLNDALARFNACAIEQRRRYAVRWNELLADCFFAAFQKPSKTFMLPSGKVESVKVHDFVPHRHKVVQKFLLGVLTSVDFRQGPELGVRTED